MIFPKSPIRNSMLFTSLPLFRHFTYLHKSAFHLMSFLTTLLEAGATKSIARIQHSPFHEPGAKPHPAPQEQVLASPSGFKHHHTWFKKQDERQEMLLHTATNCSPIAACREVLTLEQLQKGESLDAESCCITARCFPEHWRHRYPSTITS